MAHLESGLWHDEIGTLIHYVRHSWQNTLINLANQNNHILYTLLAQASFAMFGESAWSLRLPAAFFGVGSIAALFFFARKIADARRAIMACAILTVSYHHIWFSQNARGYTGILMFTLLATSCWLSALGDDRIKSWCLYAVTVALGAWTHMTMFFVVASHGLVYLLLLAGSLAGKGRGDRPGATLQSWWKPLVAFALCGTLTVQLYSLALPDFFARGLHEVSLDSEWVNPAWLVVETLRGLQAGFSASQQIIGFCLMAFALLTLTIGWMGCWRKDWVSAVCMVLPGVLIVVTMIALGHNLWPRFVFFCAGFAIVVVVQGFWELPRILLWSLRLQWDGVSTGVSVFLVVLTVVASLASLPEYYSLPKQDYRGAMNFTQGVAKTDQDTTIATAGLAAIAYKELYAPSFTVVTNGEELERLTRQHRTVWLIVSLTVHLKSWHPEIWNTMENSFKLVQVFPGSLRGGDVLVYRHDRESNN